MVVSAERERVNGMLTLITSLLFFAVGTVVLTSGIFTLQSNHKTPANRAFFALTAAIAIWSSGMAMSTTANDAATCEIFRRISAVGWSTVYAILLHFILIITGRAPSLRKWWFYLCLYLPAFFSVFAFAVPNPMNPFPYNLHQTAFGWTNTSQHNIWDWMFYAYYIGYALIGLLLLYRWGAKSSAPVTKKNSRIVRVSIIAALFLGTITDVVLSSVFSELPQMAPAIMLIPIISIYHVLQKDSFGITKGIDKKTSYMILFVSVLAYIILSALQVLLPEKSFAIASIVLDKSEIRGIFVQIQMFISIYLVLKGNRPGYIASLIINSISLVTAIGFLIRNKSTSSLPGIISYTGVLVIISLIRAYKEKNDDYIKRINTQTVREKFYSSVFKQAPVGIAIISGTEFTRNEEFDDLNINPAYERILCRTREELQNTDWTTITHPDDLATDLAYFDQFKKGKIDYYPREKRYIKPDGSVVWVDMLISRFASSNEKPGDHVCIITDITNRKNIEATLKYNSEHMLLTGLYNRGILEKTLESDALIPSSYKRALVSINLSAMHVLSLRYGNNYNQTLLRNIADSLKAYSNDKRVLFNTYEDRFVFYVKDYEDEKELTAFSERLLYTLSSYLYIHGIAVGIGILQIDKSTAHDTDELLTKLVNTSEIAAKNNGSGSNILFHSTELDIQITRENEIGQEIREIAEGIKIDRLYLHFQPILDVATNKVCKFEALARFDSEKHGFVPPLEFIPVAEKTNMLAPFGERIIILALRFLKKLKETGHDTIAVSINISIIQILENGFASRLLNMINDMHLNPENVEIELTESVFSIEREEINTVINELKAAGIKVLIDDFGTGYSSFARVSELDIDCLKIDKSFIDKLLVSKTEEAITGDIISMAHKLGHCVVAEGVEYEEQLSYLREHNCDMIQGYLISRPLDEDSALNLLKNNKK
ncbi:MAG: EAL domain-containing protein [Mesotoga sp.]